MRFFAAFYVVVFHLCQVVIPESYAEHSFGARFISLGYISVSFFFLLSGYILAIVYLRDNRSVDKRRFFAARFARIYPLFFVTLLADTPDALWRKAADHSLIQSIASVAQEFLAHLVMLHAWLQYHQLTIDGPNWSLSVETFLYLSFPLLGVFLWKLKGPRIWIAALLIYCGGQTLVWAMRTHLPLDVATYNPLFHLSTFALGILLARWQTLRVPAQSSDAPPPWLAYGVLALATTVLLGVIQLSPVIPRANLFDGLLAPIFVCAIWASSSSSTGLSHLLSAPWLVVLGEASYGLYLIHYPVLNMFLYFHLLDRTVFYPVFLLLSVCLSVLSFYYLETPSRKWLLRRFQSRARETMEAASAAQ